MRIQRSNVIVKAFQHPLQDAYSEGGMRLVQHTGVRRDLLTQRTSAWPVSLPGRKPLSYVGTWRKTTLSLIGDSLCIS